MQNLLHNLNPEQLAAVTLPAQSALILAGAGSGKTRVLTTRIAWLIQTGQVSSGGLLAVTFTNKAAKEMLSRLSAMLPINTRGMWVGTFHGLCNRLLRAHHRDAGLPQSFQILDSGDQLSFIKRLLKANNIDDEKFPPKALMYFINGAKDQGLRAAQVDAYDDFNRKMVGLYDLYDAQCQREGVVDFAELLLRTYELLSRHQPLREHYQERFRHVLVDEFQDTNDLQYKWLKLMAGAGTARAAAVFAVGDDDQSIYAFRGANVGNMSAFEREFQVENLIKLEQNYRSHGHILDSANILIANNSKRLGKNLRTDAGHGEPVRIMEASSDIAEANWIVEEAKNLLRDGATRSEIAVLYRSNAQSRVIEHALFTANIPYRVYGGQRYFDRAEIKHAIAYLQLMDNPHNDSAFMRVVNFPARGIGARSIEQLQDAAKIHGASMYAAVPHVGGKAGNSLANFVKLIEGVRFETQHLSLPETVGIVLDVSTLLTHYANEKEGADRIENLQQLVNAATQFVSEEGFGRDAPAFAGPVSVATPLLGNGSADVIIDADAALPTLMSPLSAFLSHASLEAGDNQAQAGQDAMQLMTVHSAKGLEFDAVFITGLEEGLFPHENSAQEASGVEEERRLMYVAITRARQRLYLSFSQTRMLHGQTRYNLRSRFFDELPEESLKWLTPKIQPSWFGNSKKSAWDDNGNEAANRLAQAIQAPAAGHGWRSGQGVSHPKFGEGVIVNIEGSGSNARAHINFGKFGMKLLDLSIAKLEKI
ncbi:MULTISPECIES: UvrD-helicase domain-containing protein [unclassified Undibacterium]|uniref:UvrD-helicase domain-containing protein n=1 Tax=unclassified Undibacterium TaxID=2630295 RepID=UPI002AC9E2D5|nr:MULTISPECIES: UvrD-helicase domain-containing protein [unclassified Undibacterium]MEB0138253.1 3'-5' exonuclease [Undibacterium sp. CCC2.1]MEB0171586.1 3'-5' exonuclease [Undibacterium sp. CCC1.1]MEB0175494.1 3'-5' exonuclease [Undibacterium sp. CCC3.4]MEB0214786.1 3'-5' exonuclease [Undibacterium sp. 5I2]WPX45273.1 3'-5' exonuclease [Undibacterium sp. CCC3.4]